MDAGTLSPDDGAGAGTARPTAGKSGRYGLRASYVALVMAGGGAGALARFGVEHAVPAPPGWPLATLVVNLSGAWALGALLEALHRSGPDTGTRRTVRLLVGTGFLGAFTTYSALALDVTRLMAFANTAGVTAYLAVSLFGGTVASWSGIWCGAAFHRRSVQRRSLRAPAPRTGTRNDANKAGP